MRHGHSKSETEGRGNRRAAVAALQKDEEKKTAPWTVSRMSGWQFRGADPVSHGVCLVFH